MILKGSCYIAKAAYEKEHTPRTRKKVKLYGSVSHKRPPLICGSNANLYFWPGGFDWWSKPWWQWWWCRWWMLRLLYRQRWWAPWAVIWDLFCMCCVPPGVNITPFPLRFRSCDIRLTSYSIESPTITISSLHPHKTTRRRREREPSLRGTHPGEEEG